jgi:hypothetical protein
MSHGIAGTGFLSGLVAAVFRQNKAGQASGSADRSQRGGQHDRSGAGPWTAMLTRLQVAICRLEWRSPWQRAWYPEKALLPALDEKLLYGRQSIPRRFLR